MVMHLTKKYLPIALIGSFIIAQVHAMGGNPTNTTFTPTPKKVPMDFKKLANDYFSGWGPTVTSASIISLYALKTLYSDRQAPLNTFAWLKDTFAEVSPCVKWPSLFLVGCWATYYYKPKIQTVLENKKINTDS